MMNTEEAEEVYISGWNSDPKTSPEHRHEAGIAAVIAATRQATLNEAAQIADDADPVEVALSGKSYISSAIRALGEGE